MLFVICRDGVPVKSFSESMPTWDAAVHKLKLLYIQEQTQEIYTKTENWVKQWFKTEFEFQLTTSGMHPRKARQIAIEVDELPKQVQMQHLMGAL